MNILFFLTPKNELAYIYENSTLRQALEKMEHHSYTAVPIIDSNGRYKGTLTEGDLLWTIKNKYNMSLKETENVTVSSIKTNKREIKSVTINTDIEDLINSAMNQNFVPVTTDDGIFIGIVTRRAIIEYFYKKYRENCYPYSHTSENSIASTAHTEY